MTAGILLAFVASSFWLLPQPAYPRNPVQQNSDGATRPTITWQAAGAITIPFEYFSQHIYVRVSVNGKPGLIFMLDSGANRNILNLRTARQLGIAPESLKPAGNIGFGDQRIYVGPEENVDAAISSVPIAHVMSVMDLNRFEQHFHHPTDGMLGYPFLRQFVVKIDFEKKLITLLPPDRYHYRGLGFKVPLKPSKNFVVMPVTVGNARGFQRPIDVVVDSGSNMPLMLYERAVRPLKQERSFFDAVPEQAYGLNGYYSVARGTVGSLVLGDAETRNLQVDYLGSGDQVGPARNFPGEIGNAILQSFQLVIFDVPHRRIIFQLKLPPWQPGLERTMTTEP